MLGRRLAENFAFTCAVVALPLLTIYLTIAIRDFDGALVLPGAAFLEKIRAPDAGTMALYFGWFAFQALLMAILPGSRAVGAPLENGKRLSYKMNGLAAFVITLVLAVALMGTGVVPATLFYDRIVPLLGAANLFACLFCVWLYASGTRSAEHSGVPAFFHGVTLNPRTGSFDWKFFCESRPGMILWVLIDLSLCAAQRERYGSVSNSMILVCVFQAIYVVDYFVMEEAILSTWDIRHERFGFMLAWGCLVFVPFTFSLQALWLVNHPVALPLWAVAALVLFNGTGYFIFRTSNLQKHHFRADPTRPIWGRKPEWIDTARGPKLLVSGWWGVARHANYLGDLMMGLAWCVATGAAHVLTYFYFIYFVILLVHRERRDHAHCAGKYGADWEAYVRRVRYRIVPGLY